MSSDLLSIKQAAERLDVTTEAVYDLIKRGRLPVQYIGNLRVVRQADVEAYQADRAGQQKRGPRRRSDEGEAARTDAG